MSAGDTQRAAGDSDKLVAYLIERFVRLQMVPTQEEDHSVFDALHAYLESRMELTEEQVDFMKRLFIPRIGTACGPAA